MENKIILMDSPEAATETKFGHLIDEATKTPRTDKAAFVAEFGGPVVVDADFARELEKELADAMAKLKKLRKKINEKKENEKLPVVG